MKMPFLLWPFVAGAVAAISAPTTAEVQVDSHTFGGLEARAIGPAVMGGRIAALDAIRTRDGLTIYVGAASGGVWKSANGGTTFKPVFDEHTQSIGAVTIDRRNPDVVWVGTGEPWTRNSVSIGDGVYKTTDGGQTWQHLGLQDTERIARIVIDPDDSNVVYVAALGHLWNANEQRGLYKTVDGGRTWQRVLYVDENTGCADVALDPQQPHILYAAMWQFRRWPHFFHSGGPGSGLYKSVDGGTSWRKITAGLPAGELGRIALAVAPSRPSTLYAVVEAEKTGLYRSDDLGESWRWVGSSQDVEGRPFYFALLLIDPRDFNRVYKPGFGLSLSTDGGQTFASIGGSTHADHHALWINPDNPRHLLAGTDGGLYVSYDQGASWDFLQTLPISQFYHVSYDLDDPYNVYGGLQDNGTWYGPSRGPAGVKNRNWRNIGHGDGFHAHVDRRDPDIVYVEWQGGRIQRVRRSTGETKNIQPMPDQPDLAYRFNWNTPIHLSPTRDDTLYLGSQFLLRSRDRGESWQRLSPDLTTNDPAKLRQIDSGGLTLDNSTAENYCTICTISESPLDERLIWVGTDDGLVQITRDAGQLWENVAGNIPDLPAGTWISHVEASRHDRARAYVICDGHRTGDMRAYVYRTDDCGRSFKPLAGDQVTGYCHIIREDPVNPQLLFLGTELGLYISLDGGEHWARFQGNLPKVAVCDIAIHPRTHDLILGTHGRGIYILDDITPLRHLTPEILNADFALLPARPAMIRIPAAEQEFPGDREFTGPDAPTGATIAYYLQKRHLLGDLKIEIRDSSGKLISTLPATNRRGVNRLSWSLRGKPPKVPPASTLGTSPFAFLAPTVAEGTYAVRLIKGQQTCAGTLTVTGDPRADYSAEDKALQDATVARLYDLLSRLTYVVEAILDLQNQVTDRLDRLEPGHPALGPLRDFTSDLETFRKTLVATRRGGFLAGEEQLREKLVSLYGSVNGYEGRPTDSQLRYAEVLAQRLTEVETRLAELTGRPLAQVNHSLEQARLTPINILTRQNWEAQQPG